MSTVSPKQARWLAASAALSLFARGGNVPLNIVNAADQVVTNEIEPLTEKEVEDVLNAAMRAAFDFPQEVQ